MNIPDNALAAFQIGTSTKEEDLMILNEMINNVEFSDMLDIMDEIGTIDNIDNLKFEFNDKIDVVTSVDKIR